MDWYLGLGSTVLDWGWVDYSGLHNGESFATPLPSYTVNAGDTIIFQGYMPNPSTYTWLAGVNLTIDFQPIQSQVPEPYTWWLLGSGLLGIACIRLKR